MTNPLGDMVGNLYRAQLLLVVVIFFFLVVTVLHELTPISDDWLNLFNFAGQLSLITVAAASTLRMVSRDPATIFLPPAIYLASSGLFYGFGPMSGYFSSEDTLRFFATSPYWVSPEQILRANLLSVAGIFTTLAAMIWVLSWRPSLSSYVRKPSLPLSQVAVVFLVLGFVVKYLIVSPVRFGFSNAIIPGALNNLVHLMDLGLATAAYLAAQGRRVWGLVLWFLLPPHLLITLLEFSKKSAMLALLLPAIGAYFSHQNLPRLATWAVVSALLFGLLQGINATSRINILKASEIGVVSLDQRITILSESFSNRDSGVSVRTDGSNVQGWWLRLNYSGAQVRAMEFYDRGQSGEFTQSLFIYFVPRLLWRNKPTMASPGADFHYRVTGSPTGTKVGASIYGDGYWKYGWAGLIGFSAFLGLILGLITRHTHAIVRRRDLIYLPAVFLGTMMASFSPNKFLQNGVISAIPVYLAYVLIIFGLVKLLGWYSGRQVQASSGLHTS